jgi:hypothetical protein
MKNLAPDGVTYRVEIEINAIMAPAGSPMGRSPTNARIWPRRGHLWAEIEINATMAPAGSPMG